MTEATDKLGTDKEPSLNQRFGEALAGLRRERGLSQEQLEGVVHRTYLSELERGLKSPTLQTIVKLASALEVSPAQLVGLATSNVQSIITDKNEAGEISTPIK